MSARNNSVLVRPATWQDLRRLVEIHLEAFSDHRSVRLGAAYVRACHEWFLSQPDTINLVAERGKQIIGFVEGAADNYFARMARALRPVGVRSLFCRPWLLLDGAFRHAVGRRLRPLLGLTLPAMIEMRDWPGAPFVLVSIAVSREARGEGIAGCLMREFELESLRRGYSCLRLSVYRSNASAARAYQKQGWLKMETTDPFGDYYWKAIGETSQELIGSTGRSHP